MCPKIWLSTFPSDIRACSKQLLYALLLLLLFPFAALDGQSRKELEDRRKRLLQDINQTSKELQTTKRDREATLQTYLTLQKQVANRQQLLRTLQEEISEADSSITRTNEVVAALQDDIDRLKREYARMLRVALRHKLNNSYWLFLFSSDNLNEALQRWQYLKQYDRYRKRQARLILATQKTLEAKARQLAERKEQKASSLAAVQQQQKELSTELNDKNRVLKSLKASEQKLVVELNRQQEAHRRLNEVIENIIRQEILAQNRKKAGTTTAPAIADKAAAEAKRPASLFGQARGQLPWPVDGGQITRQFGLQQHPKFKEVKTQSNGIDIRTNPNARVRAVYAGKVAGTQYIPGYQNTLILQHGEYYTVYSNLEELLVKRGDNVAAGQDIGRLNTSEPELHFEVWREKNRLNPAEWISRQ